MSDARGRILAAVRYSLVRAVLPDASAHPVGRTTRPQGTPLDRDTLVAAFVAAVVALTGRVHRAASSAHAADIVADIARDAHATSFVSWDEHAIGCPGLHARLASQGLRRLTYDVPSDPAARLRVMEDLGAVVVGVTGADAALADSGAIVLVGGPGRSRLVSLLPPIHVAILTVDRVLPDLAALFTERPGLLDEASQVVCIAGPSRTADIEMTLSHGVHGPTHVHVVLVG
jgi:L-lactate dehydrogenase complex protein LldG